MIEFDDIDVVQDNSFRNWHAPGLNYLCLSRTVARTHKVYFVPPSEDKPIVAPHNHRFNFEIMVLEGALVHYTYHVVEHDDDGEVYQHLQYKSPNVGGDGFVWVGQKFLRRSTQVLYPGERIFLWADQVHTLRADTEQGVILEQIQREDIVPPEATTDTYMKGVNKTPPSLAGLYVKPTLAEISRWFHRYRELRGVVTST